MPSDQLNTQINDGDNKAKQLWSEYSEHKDEENVTCKMFAT